MANTIVMVHAAISSQPKIINVEMTRCALTAILHAPDALAMYSIVVQLNRMGLLALWFVSLFIQF